MCTQCFHSDYKINLTNTHRNFKLREYWNQLEPHVYLELITSMAFLEKPNNHLLQFVSGADPKYIDAVFLANIILAPVNTIVNNLCAMAENTGEFNHPQKNSMAKHKLRILLRVYFLQEYVTILTEWKPQHPGADNMVQIQTDFYGPGNECTTFAELGLVPIILRYLPKKFAEWKANIKTNTSKDDQDAIFNTSLPLHSSILDSVLKQQMERPKIIEMQTGWRPSVIVRKIMDNENPIATVNQYFRNTNNETMKKRKATGSANPPPKKKTQH